MIAIPKTPFDEYPKVQAIQAILESHWRAYQDGHIAETVHTINKTHNAFR